MKTIVSKIKALFSKEVKQTEQIKPTVLSGEALLAWWRTIPPDSVLTDVVTNGKNKCCVIGHYNRCLSDNPRDYSPANTSDNRDKRPDRLRGWSIEAMIKLHNVAIDVAEVNNGSLFILNQQETPWLRVEAFFKDVAEYEKVHGPILST
jgi:hypothetical protein